MLVPAKTYDVKQLARNRKIEIDGHGNDHAWAEAVVLDDFSFPWSDRPVPNTVFRGLQNDQKFYFQFDVSDEDLVLAECVSSKDRVLGSDRVEIFISTGPELSPYYGLEMDPRAGVLSYRARFHHEFDWDWTCDGLRVRASMNDAGYLVEGSIPMKTLERLRCIHEDRDGRYLFAGLFRGEFDHGNSGQIIRNWIAWVDPEVAQADFHVPSAFGKLRLSGSYSPT